MVGLARLELATPRLSSVCSNQLSYKPQTGKLLRANFEGSKSIPEDFLYNEKSRFEDSSRRKTVSVLRKEVIQPLLPKRLPCYDLVPVTSPTVVSCPLAVSALPSGRTDSHDLTGGVYKTRERIHRSVLIYDY